MPEGGDASRPDLTNLVPESKPKTSGGIKGLISRWHKSPVGTPPTKPAAQTTQADVLFEQFDRAKAAQSAQVKQEPRMKTRRREEILANHDQKIAAIEEKARLDRQRAQEREREIVAKLRELDSR